MANVLPNTNISKSLLAKLLATENISVRYSDHADTAAFDVRNRILILPIWKNISNDLKDMLLVHETGHALDTPAVDWLKSPEEIAQNVYGKKEKRFVSAIRGFLNITEDVRVDKRQKRRYPGSKSNYLAGYKEILERDFFGIAGKDINTLPFIDRLNIYYKGGMLNCQINFTPEEMEYVEEALLPETFQETVVFTEKLFRFCKDQMNIASTVYKTDMVDLDPDGDIETEEFEEVDGDGSNEFELDSEGEKDSDSESDDKSDGKGKEKSDGKSDGKGKEKSDSKDKTKTGNGPGDDGNKKGSKKGNKSDGLKAGNGAFGEDNIPESLTEKNLEEAVKRAVGPTGTTGLRYVSIPDPVLSNIVDDYKVVMEDMKRGLVKYREDWKKANANNFMKYKRNENDTISFMVKEFEMKKAADSYSRVRISKTGVIDPNKLHSYRYNDDIFRKLSILPEGKNHGFVMFLDWSGSMQTNLKYTMSQLFSLTLFCKRVRIPFEVYLFRTATNKDVDYNKSQWNYELGSNKFAFHIPFKLRNVLSSRMSLTEFNEACINLWHCSITGGFGNDVLNSTPLIQSILAAPKIVNDFRERNKLQVVNTIFLTDGESDYANVVDSKGYAFSDSCRNIVYDNVTKREYDIGNSCKYYDSDNLTRILLQMLKDRTGCNMIGFFLSASYFHKIGSYNPSTEEREKLKKNWNDNGFVALIDAGYDQYYVINPRSSKSTTKMDIQDNMTQKQILQKFMSFSEKKRTNRVFLKQFVDLVTTNNY